MVGIESGDILPLGATVSLFMVPILAVAAVFILRDITKRGSAVLMADATIAHDRRRQEPAHGRYGSMSRDRRWALRWSYFFLVLFACFFLMPPLYMIQITSLKSQRGRSRRRPIHGGVYSPTLANYIELRAGRTNTITFFRNSAIVSIFVVIITMVIGSVIAAFALARMKFWGSAAYWRPRRCF